MRYAVTVVYTGVALLIVAGSVLAASRFLFVGTIGSPAELLVIAYRPDRLDLEGSDTFWLSPTPTKPGSHGPLDTGPHVALVADFDRHGRPLRVVNTHVGHSPLERPRGAAVLRRRLDPDHDRVAQILIGDLNATPDNPLVRTLRADTPEAPGFRDAWLEATRRSGPAETYHWSRPARDFLPLRIDYVLLRGPLRARAARVEGRARNGAVASDHDALIVDLDLIDRQ